MKINEILNEVLGNAIKTAARTAFMAAGGKLPKSPGITRKNIEWARRQLPNELYNKFKDDLIERGIVVGNKLADPSQDTNVVNMAALFLKNAYRSLIVDQDKLEDLDRQIDAMSSRVNFTQLKNFFIQANAVYTNMLQQVERTTVTSTLPIIQELSRGINTYFNKKNPKTGADYTILKKLIHDLLTDLSSASAYQIQYPFVNSRIYDAAFATGPKPDPANLEDKDAIELYQRTVRSIYILSQNKLLTIDLANKFEDMIR